jgi:hypothetical protein
MGQPQPNTTERLRQLLLELYISSCVNPVIASDEERVRVLDIVLAAGEGRQFPDLGLPFPRS